MKGRKPCHESLNRKCGGEEGARGAVEEKPPVEWRRRAEEWWSALVRFPGFPQIDGGCSAGHRRYDCLPCFMYDSSSSLASWVSHLEGFGSLVSQKVGRVHARARS